MTTSTTESDRAFERAVGISHACEMCDLLTIQGNRRGETVNILERQVAVRDRLIKKQRHAISMWRLATFAASLVMLMFVFADLRTAL